jgi:hypothetical protein
MSGVSFFKRGVIATAFGLVTFTSIASAETISCRSFAEAAADEWANGRIYPVGPADVGTADQVTIISYGRKYVVPRHTKNSGVVFPVELGNLATQRNEVYTEELARCQYHNKLNITIYTK